MHEHPDHRTSWAAAPILAACAGCFSITSASCSMSRNQL
jgi:hypothetical protein